MECPLPQLSVKYPPTSGYSDRLNWDQYMAYYKPQPHAMTCVVSILNPGVRRLRSLTPGQR